MTSDEPLPRPVEIRRRHGDLDPTSNTIKVMTMKASKSLGFPVVVLPRPGDDEKETKRVFYAVATQRLALPLGSNSRFVTLLRHSNVFLYSSRIDLHRSIMK